ncbi:MAG: malate dehydrogenase [Actinobacteria bacterium]|nr:malate dehydrogenase [Actinomycetota bacterium]
MAKVSIVGAGHVGATCAYTLVKNDVADVVLVDIVDGLAKGKSLDMMEAGAIEGYDRSITGTADYAQIEGSDIAIVTAGLARQPGMSRSDLLCKNADILKVVLSNITLVAPEALIIIVTNPADAMTQLAHKATGHDSRRVLGMSGVLDSARYKFFISQALGAPMSSIEGMVIGAHGDTMLPVVSQTTVDGRPLVELLPQDKIDEIIDRTKFGGAEIVSYLKTGSAYYAPGAAAAKMAQAIINDTKEVLPCSVLARGEYGIEGLYIGLPVRLGKDGAEGTVEIPLSDAETEAMRDSVKGAKTLLAELPEFKSIVI